MLKTTMAQTALNRSDKRTTALRETIADLIAMDEPRKRYAGMMSGLGRQSGALDLFGVLAGRDRNGEIFAAANFPPTGSTARTRRNQAAINTPG